jgi:hypothetical protein
VNFQQWLSEFCARLMVNEGVKTHVYLDNAKPPNGPNRTIGVGYNLERPDAVHALETAGVTHPYSVIAGAEDLTPDQVRELLEYSVAPIVAQARASLQPLHFDLLSDGRRLAIADMEYNLGPNGWDDYVQTRALIDDAVHTVVRLKNPNLGHTLFGQAAAHIRASSYASEVGDRAIRNAEMIETSVIVPAEKTYA